MPELPDVTVYVERLSALFRGKRVLALRVRSPFVVRTYEPPVSDIVGRTLRGAFRIGKRIALEFEPKLYLVIHLMIAGRLHLKPKAAPLGKPVLLAFDFDDATLLLTEAGTKKRASVHVVATRKAALELGRGGVEPLEATDAELEAALLRENRTLKRALTDPRLLSGIGNAYSDEILFRAKLSPLKRTFDLDRDELARLIAAIRELLVEWTERLRREVGQGFPEKVTAFRPEMAMHGKFGQPCPVCGTKVQRIAYAQNECNYCPSCQTRGKLLADRALSRLLRDDWPRTLEELEERKTQTQQANQSAPTPDAASRGRAGR